MAFKNIKARIRLKRDSESDWENQKDTCIPLNGELIFVDTATSGVRSKLGDGVHTYGELPFLDETIKSKIETKVDKVTGKGLSTNDYTTAEKEKLSGLKNYSLPLATDTVRGGIKVGSEFTLSNEALTVDEVSWSKVSNTPTTLSGYGITNDVVETSDVVQGIEETTTKDNFPVSQSAVKSYVVNKVNEGINANEAMVFKGTLGTGGTITQLLTSGYKVGWAYKVITAGTYAGIKCEVGDLIIAIKNGPSSGTAVVNSDWTVVQSNIDGAITSSSSLTANQLVLGNGHSISTLTAGSNGQVLKMDNGRPTWGTDNNTNTTYTFANGDDGSFTVTPSGGSAQKVKIGVASSANYLNLSSDIGSTTRPVYFDVAGFPEPISYTINSNVPANAIFTDTTYSNFNRSADGLVPHPTTTTSTRFLREDGTWQVPKNTTYGLATTAKKGLLAQLSGNTSEFMRGDGNWATPSYPVTQVNNKTGAVSLNYADVGAIQSGGVTGQDGNHNMAMSWNGAQIIVGIDNNAAVKTLVTTDDASVSDTGWTSPWQSTNWVTDGSVPFAVYIRRSGHVVSYEYDLTNKYVLNVTEESAAKLVTYDLANQFKPAHLIYHPVTVINGAVVYFVLNPDIAQIKIFGANIPIGTRLRGTWNWLV